MEFKRTSVQQLLQVAAAESYSFRHGEIDTEHVLLAMLKTGGVETQALLRAGTNYSTLRKIVLSNNEPGTNENPTMQTSAAVRRLLLQARQIADQNNEKELFAEYVLLAILNDKSGLASVMLTIADVDKRAIYQNLVGAMRENQNEDTDSNLSRYGTNLNDEAKDGKIDPVIGRDREINRVIQILSRRTKKAWHSASFPEIFRTLCAIRWSIPLIWQRSLPGRNIAAILSSASPIPSMN